MPDLKPSVVDAPGNGRESAAVATADRPDPLARLHKMSTTAGLGSQDYVAVNPPAVFALIFGLASGLVIVDNVLLIIPLAGVIAAILALYQISKSGGTQTGRGLAVLGLLLSLGCAGFVLTRQATYAARTRADRLAITELVDQFAQNIKSGDFAAAYQQFDKKFRDLVPQQAFSDRAKFLQGGAYGNLVSITTNNVFFIQTDPTTGTRHGQVMLLIKFTDSEQPMREEAVFRKTEGKWEFDDIPAIFRSLQPNAAPPGGSPGMGAPPGMGGPGGMPPGMGGPGMPPGGGMPPPGGM
jgi:hypothetical protein